MKPTGETIKTYYGKGVSGFTSLGNALIIIGTVGTIMFFVLSSFVVGGAKAFFIFLALGGLFSIGLDNYLAVRYSKKNYEKTFLEIRTDGIVLLPITNKRLSITYDELRSIHVTENGNVCVEPHNDSASYFSVVDQTIANEICDTVRKHAEAYKCAEQ